MNRDEAIELLKGGRKGIEEWNRRREAGEEIPELDSAGLSDAGFGVLPVEGTYFLTTDIRQTGFSGTDVEFCQHITEQAGVTALPMSAFYLSGTHSPQQAPDHFVRFCFCKKDDVLDAASEKLISFFA